MNKAMTHFFSHDLKGDFNMIYNKKMIMPNKVWISNTLSYLFCLKIDDKKNIPILSKLLLNCV